MSLTSASEFNNLGAGIGAGGFGGFGGSMGGFGLIGLVGLKDLFDRDRKGDDGCAKEIATLAAISNLKDVTIAETRAIDMAICDVKANVKDALYATAIQAERNTNDIKTQAQAFQIANDRKFDEISREGERNTALILAKINQDKIDDLRDSLHLERRRVDARELEINVTNSNTSIQQQLQAQAQQQQQKQMEDRFAHDRKFDLLFAQVAKASQDIINVGGLMVGSSNTANPTNIK